MLVFGARFPGEGRDWPLGSCGDVAWAQLRSQPSLSPVLSPRTALPGEGRPRPETNCPWRLRATERGGRDGPSCGHAGLLALGLSSPQGWGPAVARLPALTSWLRRCSRSDFRPDLRPGAAVFFFFLSRKLLLWPCSVSGEGRAACFCAGGRPPPPPRACLCRQLGPSWNQSDPPSCVMCRVPPESLFGFGLEVT